MKNKKIHIFKVLLLIIVVILCISLIIDIFPIIRNISTPQGKQELKELIKSSGIKGVLLLFGLQIAQIFLVILPGEPLEILAGMCYGEVWGTVFLLVSVWITTAIIFYAVRKYGRKFIYDFCNKEKIEKLENSKWFKKPKNIEYVLIILFMIPGSPKDLLVYIGGLLPIKPIRFINISTFARFPSIISSTLAGANIVEENWIMMVIVYVVPLLIALIIIAIMKTLERSNETN